MSEHSTGSNDAKAAFVLPTPRTPDPRTAPPLRWGVIGPGVIATSFVEALQQRTRQEVVAVGSRSIERAERFAAAHDIPSAYGSYQEVVDLPNVDVVYVASRTASHEEHVVMALAAGKHVIVEKPLTTTEASAERMIEAARRAGLLLMEAMWTRYRPHADIVRQVVDSGILGEIHLLTADFSDYAPDDPLTPFGLPTSTSGLVFDIGTYPTSWASWLLGDVEVTATSGLVTDDGTERRLSLMLRAASGADAVLHATWLSTTPGRSVISGSRGYLEVDHPFFEAPEIRLYDRNGVLVDTWRDTSGWPTPHALAFEAAACAEFITTGRTESPVQSLDETRRVIAILEAAHGQVHGCHAATARPDTRRPASTPVQPQPV